MKRQPKPNPGRRSVRPTRAAHCHVPAIFPFARKAKNPRPWCGVVVPIRQFLPPTTPWGSQRCAGLAKGTPSLSQACTNPAEKKRTCDVEFPEAPVASTDCITALLPRRRCLSSSPLPSRLESYPGLNPHVFFVLHLRRPIPTSLHLVLDSVPTYLVFYSPPDCPDRAHTLLSHTLLQQRLPRLNRQFALP
ncbi:hypothetical protein CGRA01v4_00947 [Colletotrichum graminicola]|nr:hypothetical protein CGRA01v4_00947 [Colletotrichum graminicola]